MVLGSNNDTPLYKQISEYIRQKIEQKEWEIGHKIPTEHELCEQFNVSRITVVKALSRLVEEGLLVREQGKGTFVSVPPLLSEPSPLLSFTEMMKEQGKTPGSLVLEKSWKRPSSRDMERLKVSENEQIYKIKRLMLADTEPIGIQTSYLSMKRFPDLINKITDHQSLYEILQREYNLIIDSAIETYNAVQLDEEEKSLLKVDIGETGFSVERLSFSNDEPVEFVRSIMRNDQVRYSVKLIRKR